MDIGVRGAGEGGMALPRGKGGAGVVCSMIAKSKGKFLRRVFFPQPCLMENLFSSQRFRELLMPEK